MDISNRLFEYLFSSLESIKAYFNSVATSLLNIDFINEDGYEMQSVFVRDSSSSEHMNVNGSVTPVTFTYKVPDNRRFIIKKINSCITDSSINSLDYGGIAGGLTNGLQMYYKYDLSSADVYFSETDVSPIKNNVCFQIRSSNIFVNTVGATDSICFSIDLGENPIILNETGSFNVIVRDDLTPLDGQRIILHGYSFDI